MTKITRDFIAGILMFLLSLFYFVMTLKIRSAPIGNAHAPKIYPLILMVGGMVIALTLLGYTYVHARNKKVHEQDEVPSDSIKHKNDKNVEEMKMLLRISISTTILGIGFAFVFEKLGYLLSMSLFLAGFMFLINGKKSWKVNIITPIMFSVLSYVIFKTLLSVPLPLFLDL